MTILEGCLATVSYKVYNESSDLPCGPMTNCPEPLEEGLLLDNSDSFTFKTGGKMVLSEIDHAVRKMTTNDEAQIVVYAHDMLGQQRCAVLSLHPKAKLRIIVKLESVHCPSTAVEREVDSATEAASQARLRGNKHFADAQFLEALCEYRRAERILGRAQSLAATLVPPQSVSLACRDRLESAMISSTLNCAACHLKLGNAHKGERKCCKVLKRDSKNVKALFRRAQSFSMIGEHDRAIEDLQVPCAASLALQSSFILF